MTTLDADVSRVRVDDAAESKAVVAVPRRRIDAVLVSLGVVATVVLGVAGGLLTWGNHFAGDYVHDELTEQNVFFPTADKLTAEGRTDLLSHAGDQVSTGAEAQAYASYIHGHLAGCRRRRHVRGSGGAGERGQGGGPDGQGLRGQCR